MRCAHWHAIAASAGLGIRQVFCLVFYLFVCLGVCGVVPPCDMRNASRRHTSYILDDAVPTCICVCAYICVGKKGVIIVYCDARWGARVDLIGRKDD